MPYYLCIGNDPLDVAARHTSKRAALAAFHVVAEELARYGQAIEGTIHIAERRSECAEYPDFVLSLGPRGGLRCERV